MEKISCIIVDDEPNAVSLLEDYAREVPFLELKHKCYSAIEALEFLEKESVDIIFLDINLPNISGLEFSSMVALDQAVIFTTAYSEYALESYQCNAIDYLLKPITSKRFFQSVIKARRYLGHGKTGKIEVEKSIHRSDYIFIKSGKQHIRIVYDDIFYIEAKKEYVTIKSSFGETMAYKRMKNLELSLPDSFVRIHNSYIINTDHLEKVSDNHVFIMGARLPISSAYKERLYTFINQRLL